MRRLPRITFWWGVYALIALAGLYSTGVRVFGGLGAATHLSDAFPSGLWTGFNVFCGIGLSFGGSLITTLVYVFSWERYRPLVRATLLTAFLGNVAVVLGLSFELGLPYRIWHPMIDWNLHSPLFFLAWGAILYLPVLFLEFSPSIFERFGMRAPLRLIHTIILPLVIVGFLIAAARQSLLGTYFLIAPGKLHPLWYTPLLPILYLLSAAGVSLAMTIFEAFLCHRAFRTRLNRHLLVSLAKASAWVLGIYAVLDLSDLVVRGKLPLLVEGSMQSSLFIVELVMGVLLPCALFASRRARASDTGLYGAAVLAICGFILNRLDVAITGAQGHETYIPAWTEMAVSMAIVATMIVVFGLAARFLPVFPTDAPAAHEEDGLYVPLAGEPERAREPRPVPLAAASSGGIVAGMAVFLALCGMLLRPHDKTIPVPTPSPIRFAAPIPVTEVASLRVPSPFAFPEGQASPGKVTFSHQTHLATGSVTCRKCHTDLFALSRSPDVHAGGPTMEVMRRCSRCHDGRIAFDVRSDCRLCHTAPTRRMPPIAMMLAPMGSLPPAPADYAFEKGKGSPGTVTFSHARHLSFGSGTTCATCHPTQFHMLRPDPTQAAEFSMTAMRAGKSCGVCHNGRSAFTVAKECTLCHVPASSPAPVPVSSHQVAPPADKTYRVGQGSPGPVTFSHKRHMAATKLSCTGCHPQTFSMVGGLVPTMSEMRAGKECGACHNGRRAFTVSGDCSLCHASPAPAPAGGTKPAASGASKGANAVGGGYIPYPNKQGLAVFSHLSHSTAGFGCGDCHTAIFPMKRGSFKMADLYAKKACGKCHNGETKAPKDGNRVAFDVMMCTSCHAPAKAITYSPKGFAPVAFQHASHTANGAKPAAGYSCGACHTKLFERKANTMKMPFPHTTECATCHGSKSVSPSGRPAPDASKCVGCHKAPAGGGR